ncbi:MAG: hypothetical protein K8U03_26545 [Planctomycetia bacterium]|nr:hypothetical protein [Planctomycetia bacterium]
MNFIQPVAAIEDGAARIVLAAGADEAFAFPLTITMHGAVSHLSAGRGADIYIVDGGIRPETQAKMRRIIQGDNLNIEVRFLAPDLDRLSNVPVAHINAMTYLRLLLPDLLPAEIDHVLYLDSDLLIRGDLGIPWSLRSHTRAIAATREFSAPRVSAPRALPNWEHLGLPPDAPYINAGLLLMNLKRWREENIASRILEYVRRTTDINRYADQDGINAILCQDCELLPAEWNVPAYFESNVVIKDLDDPISQALIANRHRLLREAFVIHFIGPRKPWRNGLGLKCQWDWLEQAKYSGWFESAFDYARFSFPIWVDYTIRRAMRKIRELYGK